VRAAQRGERERGLARQREQPLARAVDQRDRADDAVLRERELARERVPLLVDEDRPGLKVDLRLYARA
jgi:hypothetical protein